MDRLQKQHVEFLQHCAQTPMKTHASELPVDELQQMTDEGLLKKYNRAGKAEYCITAIGTKIARSYGASEEIKQLATAYVTSKGYTPEAAESIVEQEGAENLLKAQAAEMRGGNGQKEVTVPTNEMGKPEIKFRG